MGCRGQIAVVCSCLAQEVDSVFNRVRRTITFYSIIILCYRLTVAPFTGAWIETENVPYVDCRDTRRPLHGGVD